MWPYATEEEALEDVLRLSSGMTYKNAAMGLNLGGGKAVILADPRMDKTEVLFRAFGRFVESLSGRYITAEDVGTTCDDMNLVRMETQHVRGLPEISGEPSPATAYGVYRGMAAAALAAFGSESLKGLTIALQGVGSVGLHLARHLHEEGASLVVTDIFPDKAERAVKAYGARAVAPGDIYDVECDIFAPCALGAVINDGTVSRLKCRVVAGAANNQLAEERHGDLLGERGILYVPDFLINGGGVISVADEMHPSGYSRDRVMAQVSTIFHKVTRALEMAQAQGISNHRAAEVLAEERMRSVGRLGKIHLA
jgi:leucine dehydrogenase